MMTIIILINVPIFLSLNVSASLLTLVTPPRSVLIVSFSVLGSYMLRFVIVCLVLFLFVAFSCIRTTSNALRECNRARSLTVTPSLRATRMRHGF